MAKMTAYNHIAGLNAALRRLPKESRVELTNAAQASAQVVADDARARGARLGGAWRYLTPTIKAARGRTPTVKIGGKRRIPGRRGGTERQTVGDLLWGLEFGGGARPRTMQFDPWRGNDRSAGYALWPAVRAHSDDTMERYSQALLDALEAIP